MGHITKTNAARLLDKAGIAYRLIPYTVDETDLAATHVACELGEDISGVSRSAPEKAARAAGAKKADLIPMKELLPATGYIRGGCSPIGMRKPFPTFIHESAQLYDEIFISAGIRGLQLAINPQQLADFTGSQFTDLIVSNE